MADELVQGDRLFRRLVEHSLDIMVVLSADATIRFTSPSVRRLLGYEERALIGRSALDFIHPDDRQRAATFLLEQLATAGVAPVIDLRFRRADGAWRILEVIGTNLLDDPDIGALVANARDITEWEEDRAALRTSEERYRTLVEQSTEGIWRLELEEPVPTDLPVAEQIARYYRFAFVAECNDAMARMQGLAAADELVGARLAQLFPGDNPSCAALLEAFVSGGYRIAGAESYLRVADGPVRHYLNSVAGIVTDGALVRAWGVRRDDTERHLTARRLVQNEARLRVLLEQLPALVWTTDAALHFTSSSGAGLRALGLTTDEIVGSTLQEYFGTSDSAFLPIACHIEALGGRSRSFEQEWGGAVFEVHVEPLRDADGVIVGTIGVALDVSDRRRLEEQLRHAQKLEAIGQLTGGIAHDFNNLLTVILTNAELIDSTLPDDAGEMRDDVAEIRQAAQRGSRMIKKLLGFSRRDMLALRPLALVEFVEGASETLRRMLPENVAVRVEAPTTELTLRADEAALHQILMNLATNARDAMPEGGQMTIALSDVTLPGDVGVRSEDRPSGRCALIAVGDTGAGMSADVRARAFEPFFTTKPPDLGSGLGLAMIYGLVKQHGGLVELDSAPGRGTRVHVYLPIVEGAPAGAGGAVAAVEPTEGHETILVVEDESAIRDAARRVLERQGYRVITARDGVEALECFRAHEGAIGLIVCDVVMPRLGGRQVQDALTREGKSVPFLFTSGHTGRGAPEAGALDAATPFLAKPWNATELLQRVRAALDAAS